MTTDLTRVVSRAGALYARLGWASAEKAFSAWINSIEAREAGAYNTTRQVGEVFALSFRAERGFRFDLGVAR